MSTEADRYAAACDQLLFRIRTWLQEHPTTLVVFTWKIPQGAFVASTVSDAMRAGFLTANDGGRALIDSVRMVNGFEVSVMMFKICFEVVTAHLSPADHPDTPTG